MIADIRMKDSMLDLTRRAYTENKRLVVPLVGFPGAEILNTSIKVAQQNHGMHYNCIEALVHQLKPDAAFMMMDLSVEANALGLPVRFPTDESSTVELHPVKKVSDLDHYRRINIMQDARVQSYVKTIEMMRIGLSDDVKVGAYIIGPVTLAGLLESAEQVALDSVLEPEKLHGICRFTTSIIIEYAKALTAAGADIVCILDPTASILGPEQFREFTAGYVANIMDSYKYDQVDTIYHICGNTTHLLEPMRDMGIQALSLDSPETGLDLAHAAKTVGEDVIIIGNVNPTLVMRDGTVQDVEKAVNELMEKMRPYPNFILSTGCDLPPGTPLENMKAFMRAGRNFK